MQTRILLSLTLLAAALTACGDTSLTVSNDALSRGDAFVRVSRSSVSGTQRSGLGDAGVAGHVTHGNDDFYIAIKKSELAQKFFLSAYLTQWHPVENTPMRSLGTRVVSFKQQNGKLFVFDVADGKGWSDTLDPSVVLEAWPVVTNNEAFNALTHAANYVLVDPSAGLNRFSFVADDFANRYEARFQVDLAYMQNFRALADGVTFEQVFTGYTEVPGRGVLAFEQPFRGSGTLSMALRRYKASPAFAPRVLPTSERNYFGSSNWRYVKDVAAIERYAVKWDVRPGMTPIDWRISDGFAAYRADPRLAGIDVEAAIARGVEGWNEAFGFQVFRVVPTTASDSPGDDEKNFIVVDRNPGAGLAFANWRENPNTGEIRGASVYFSSIFVESALAGAPEVDAGTPPVDAGVDAGLAVDAGAPADGGTGTCTPDVIISQVFGGNGVGNAFNQDFVELHNRSTATVSLDGWSLQYAASAGTFWSAARLSGTIAPGGFFLVGLTNGNTDAGTLLPALDAVGSLSLSASSGKVALVRNTDTLSGECPVSADLVDFIGYGSSANCAEGTRAPTASSTNAVIRVDVAACQDTQNNAADFIAAPAAPRNASAPAAACVCAAAPVAPQADGGVALTAPVARAAPPVSLSWDAMAQDSVCAMGHDLRSATIPDGMTRKQFLEAVITHTILHEVGHTLGLRHNFKGSQEGSSVMDYLRDEQSAVLARPGAYDTAAVRHLYGLDAQPASQAFCTDEHRYVDATCDIWDTGANALTDDVGPRLVAKVNALISGTGSVQWSDIHRVTRYVRAPRDEAQRLEAFNLLVGRLAPPLAPEVLALGADAGPWSDSLSRVFLQNLFLDAPESRDEIGDAVSIQDVAFRARVIAVAKSIITGADAHRSFDSRRVAVDVLKVMQHHEAYLALTEARAALVTERARYTAPGQALVDDVIRRIDVQTSPYFVR